MAGEIAHTGGAFAFPGVERVGSATDVGREFVTVTSDEVDTDTLCEEDMTLGVRSRRSRSKGVHVWPHRVTCFCSENAEMMIFQPIGRCLLQIEVASPINNREPGVLLEERRKNISQCLMVPPSRRDRKNVKPAVELNSQ